MSVVHGVWSGQSEWSPVTVAIVKLAVHEFSANGGVQFAFAFKLLLIYYHRWRSHRPLTKGTWLRQYVHLLILGIQFGRTTCNYYIWRNFMEAAVFILGAILPLLKLV